MPDAITVRRAVEADVPGVGVLWKEMMAFHEALDPRFERASDGEERFAEFLRASLANEKWLLVVADDGGTLVGYGMAAVSERPPVLKERRMGLVSDLAVSAAYRRRGIGRRLVDEMMRWFREQGLQHAEVNVATCNPLATAFWRSVRFGDYLERRRREVP